MQCRGWQEKREHSLTVKNRNKSLMPSWQRADDRKGTDLSIFSVVSGIHNSHYSFIWGKEKLHTYCLLLLPDFNSVQHWRLICRSCAFVCLFTFVWMTEYSIGLMDSICKLFMQHPARMSNWNLNKAAWRYVTDNYKRHSERQFSFSNQTAKLQHNSYFRLSVSRN